MELLLFNAFNGLIQGVFYALMALGLALILSLNSVINMAHGGFLVIGAYLAYTLIPYLGFWGALIVGPILAGVIGLLVERALIRPIYKRADPLYSLLLTFGLALIIEDLVRTIWGPQGLPFEVPDIINSPVSSEYFFVTGYRLFVIGITAAAAIGLYLLLRYTLLGIRIRAGTRDLETTSALGVNIYKLRALNFGFGCLLAGLSGVLAAGVLGLTPPMGDSLIMPSFVAIIVGGVGSLFGAVVGGLIIGLAAGITTTYYPAASEAVIYLMMLIVLVVRPRGLFGEEGLFE
ncbi:MAG TPA: branched-chain amino acid ABC transporter permease [Pseudolabrys sp.]|jgi:branched-chain amino acid transport system permease protein|uniref:branched-chain amino acid ABC transporter permease n=1 Tax=Pseudolabrys sp. TaxID=1960880 RepID=UPI002DDD8817|nr:branched-chain amino acid ABC transporter permease [Pseudolabrys sp.]HEV2631018.1 branched-chain amino acid ABC transporter permease [Pseudolabrys sp.]